MISAVVAVAGCSSATKQQEYETNLLQARVSRITERLQVMITHKKITFSENLELITDSVIGCIETQTI